MAAYFLFAAAVQLNDPDAPVWIAIYAAAAAVSFHAVRRAPPPWAPVAVGLTALAWALTLMPAAIRSSFPELFASWRMMSAEMEVGREFLGLLIVAAWMAALFVRSARTRH
jgi:hypothetical protein